MMTARIDELEPHLFDAGYTIDADNSPSAGAENRSMRFETLAEARSWIEREAVKYGIDPKSIFMERGDT